MSRPTFCYSASLDRCDQCDLFVDLEGFQVLHNWGCSWGLNPPVSRSARVM